MTAGALNLLNDYQHLDFLVAIQSGEGRAAIAAQRRMAVLHRILDVLRIIVNSADDDQILDTAGHKQFAVFVHKGRIAGPEPRASLSPTTSRKSRLRCHGVSPIAFRNVGAADPNFADMTCRQRLVSIPDRQ